MGCVARGLAVSTPLAGLRSIGLTERQHLDVTLPVSRLETVDVAQRACRCGRSSNERNLSSSFLGEQLEYSGQGRLDNVQVGTREEKCSSGTGRLQVAAKIRKTKRAPMDPDYPWPDKYKAEEHGFLAFLSKFNQNPGKKSKPVTLPFERPLQELEAKIQEVRELARKTGMDFSEQISELETKYEKLREDIYLRLTPVQRLSVARHPNRPTFLDHVHNITDKWVELHGDRGGYDDPALVTGIGRIDDLSFMFIGHQKGRNTQENIYRNFGMATPNGYRKALRMMRHADHHGFPILMFIDTPGAYAGVSAEELGQGEAIAHNLREMFGLRVPTICVVIGEGGSGGALGIGCCNKMLMLENAVYYVASPEACAAILWKTASAAPKATEALRITGTELQKLNVVDEVIKEPVGGAHSDPLTSSLNIKAAILGQMKELLKLDEQSIMAQRLAKFRQMGGVLEAETVNPNIQRSLKKRDRAPSSPLPRPQELPSPLHALDSRFFSSNNRAVEANSTPVNISASMKE